MYLSVVVFLLTDACHWKHHLFGRGNKNDEKRFHSGGRFSRRFTSYDPFNVEFISIFQSLYFLSQLRIFKALRRAHWSYLIFMFPWCYHAFFYKQHWYTRKVWIIPLLDGGGFFLLWANHNNNSRHYMMACIYHVVRGNPSCRISYREISLR